MTSFRSGSRPPIPPVALLLVALGCAGQTPPPDRPEPIAYADTLPIRRPEPRRIREASRLVHEAVEGEVGHGLSVRRWVSAEHEAANLTRFDDVVNSAWFEHRNARRPLTPEELARGPGSNPPDTARPFTVIAGKKGGISPGFTVRDARGQVFLFKFDPRGNLHLASAADVISSRLFWGAGYYTPEDYIVSFDPDRLHLAGDARIGEGDEERAMTRDDIRAALARTDSMPDGRYLALASKLLPGELLGPFLFQGVRRDDPNDYYLHQFRRELRGLYVVASWLNHVDMRFENTRDVFIDPPGYVRHYLIDFAATLGSGTIRPHNPREGLEYNFDLWPTLGRLFTLGFYQRGWEGRGSPVIHPSIGWLPVQSFDPGRWRPNWPNRAFRAVTDRDGYWGAKLVASFSDEQLRAVVETAHLPTPEVEDTLVDILSYRRDRVVEYWFARVTPIEEPRVDSGDPLRIRFRDLGLEAGVREASETTYEWQLEGDGLRASGSVTAGPGPDQTIAIDPDGDPGASPTLRVRVQRSGASGRDAVIYLQRHGPTYRVAALEH